MKVFRQEEQLYARRGELTSAYLTSLDKIFECVTSEVSIYQKPLKEVYAAIGNIIYAHILYVNRNIQKKNKI